MRITFAFDPDRSAILLIGGDKSGISQERFYKRLITQADQLYDRYLKQIAERQRREDRRDGENIR